MQPPKQNAKYGSKIDAIFWFNTYLFFASKNNARYNCPIKQFQPLSDIVTYLKSLTVKIETNCFDSLANIKLDSFDSHQSDNISYDFSRKRNKRIKIQTYKRKGSLYRRKWCLLYSNPACMQNTSPVTTKVSELRQFLPSSVPVQSS